MDRMQKAEAYRNELGKTGAPALAGTDPELAAIRERLEYGEIAGQGCLDARRRRLITLVVLAAIQTPQAFVPEIIKAALTRAIAEQKEYTDDCAAVEAMGVKVHLSKGSPENIKITGPVDIPTAEAILKSRGE